MKQITFPVAQHISPGLTEFRFRETIETEVWVMGIFIQTTVEVVDGIFTADVPDPGFGNRTTFSALDRTFTVVRDDDESFWGPDGKEGFLHYVNKWLVRDSLEDLAEQFGWDLDEKGNPQPPAVVFSKSQLESENKTLMAHIMAELKIFPSVGQARKNGWDKPLVIGDYSVTKKKIRFKIIE